MKLLASISLMTLFLIQVSNMDVCCELQKLPSLIEHYSEHETKYGTSLLDFMSMHYGNESKDHEDDQHDQNLPFQGKHQCQHAPVFFTLDMPFAWNSVEFPVSKEFNSYTVLVKSEYAQTLFQPPKV